jgi:hypothetical protein
MNWPRRVASLWKMRADYRGEAKLTGVLNLPDGSTLRVALYPMKRKRRASSPDFVLYLVPDGERASEP